MKRTRKTLRIPAAVLCALLVMPLLFSVLCTAAGSSGGLAKAEQRQYYKNEASVMTVTPEVVTFKTDGVPDLKDGGYRIDLDGTWLMTDKGKISTLSKGEGWDSAINATVPGSIYTALFEAGVIPDPYDGDNMKSANRYSEKNWYFKKTFDYKGGGKNVLLSFEGVCNVADFYLNGVKIGSHEGMFGGPYIDITDKVKQGENTLVVHLFPAKDYTKTVVFNCSYGWHYAKLYPLGIWQSVSVSDQPSVTLDHPFITTADYKKGTVDLAIELDPSNGGAFSGKLTVKVSPKNFTGKPAYFTSDVSGSGETLLRYRADIPDAHLWWPNGYGAQDLYDLTVTFEEKGGGVSYSKSEFGVRELDYAPFPSGENSSAYNRQFVINGVDVYMKGAGWCTIDAMMRFTREDYDRILSRAHDAGINFFRSWGGGLVETEEFYDLCDEYGICVYQEWPCCWDSSKTQPADVLYETVILNCKRLRNRPSLVVWGGGNEGEAPYSDKVLNNMGKLTYETDGTRDFWRQDGGIAAANIRHDHIWWSGASPEYYLKTYAGVKNLNMHEYGLGAMMNRQSISKFSTEKEMAEWPIGKNSSIAYHTATFNGYTGWTQTPYGYDIDAHTHYASLFTDVDNLDELILGSQLSQAQADYPCAINSRVKAPYNSANVIYKLNDCYPGASWSIVDWYGAPKIAYYLMQDAYRPVMACFATDKYNTIDPDKGPTSLSLPVYVLDDTVSLKGEKTAVTVTAYDENLAVIKTQTYDCKIESSVNKLGRFELTPEQTDHTPLIIAVDLTVNGEFYNRTYMYFNYEYESGCLFYLPRTTLEYSVSGNTVTVTNTGSVPAIGVQICSSAEDTFVCSDSYFMLTPGQSEKVTVNDISLFTGIDGFNLALASDKTAPMAPGNVKVDGVTSNKADVSWTASKDDNALFGYTVTVKSDDETKTYFIHRTKTSAVITGLSETTDYTLTVYAEDNSGNRSAASSPVKFSTVPELGAPQMLSADMNADGKIDVSFSVEMNAEKLADPSHYLLNNGASVTEAAPAEDGRSVTLTVENYDDSLTYTLGVIGLTDTRKSQNNTGYQQITVTKLLYMFIGFEPDADGNVKTSGKVSATVSGVNGEPSYIKNGYDGYALSVASARGVQVSDVDFSFPDNSSVTMMINGKVKTGYNVLLAKGPKGSGHFEFYTNSGSLYMYAPDVGDIYLRYDLNSGPDGWRQLAFVRENGMLTVYDGGVAVSKVSLTGRIAERTETLSIGVLNDGTLPYAGAIDSVCLYERALQPSELTVKGEEGGAAENGLDFSEHVITLSPGESADLTVAASDGVTYTVSTHGGSAAFDGSKVTAAEPGETLIYARSDDGRYISAAVIKVKEPKPAETEPVTTEPAQTEPAGQTEEATEKPAESTGPSGKADGKGSPVVIIMICAAAAAAAAVTAIVLIKKKKK